MTYFQTPPPKKADAQWAFDHYQAIRPMLPSAVFPKTSIKATGLTDLANDFDVFLLDAYGVLNVGHESIESAPKAVRTLQQAGKKVMVLTNGATVPVTESQKKFAKLGFDFALEDIIASRNALFKGLAEIPQEQKQKVIWGVMGSPNSQLDTLPQTTLALADDQEAYDRATGFIFLGAIHWNEHRQALLHKSLTNKPREIWVGNPDLVAPYEKAFSFEPGYFAHRLGKIEGVKLHFYGKPFANVFELASLNLNKVAKHRILMVGDTLHTDILGGAAFGVKTALVTGHGLFANESVAPFIQKAGIVPDYIMTSP